MGGFYLRSLLSSLLQLFLICLLRQQFPCVALNSLSSLLSFSTSFSLLRFNIKKQQFAMNQFYRLSSLHKYSRKTRMSGSLLKLCSFDSLSNTPPTKTNVNYSRIQELVVTNSSRQTLLNLISFGDTWIKSKEENLFKISDLTEDRGYISVPGCMATVRLKVNVNNSLTSISGIADSRVALGMLAMLAELLEGQRVDDLLSIPARDFSNILGLDSLLPPGRLDGFHNMIITIQKKINQNMSNCSSVNKSTEKDESIVSHDFRGDEIAVLLSGGVDSSVALKLLLDQGHKVRAYYLKIWLEDEVAHLNECPWEEDLRYAKDVCDRLNVPLETLSLQKEYWEYVVEYTLGEARLGRTPNPDIMCNSRIKFGMFFEYVGKYHKKIATGHYASICRVDHLPEKIQFLLGYSSTVSDELRKELLVLQKSPDPVKDQSYFLSNLRQDQLQRCLFPIGALQKEEVRRLADQFDLPTKARKDSQGICFLGKLPFDEFIGHYMGESPGDIRDYESGQLVGKHRGLWFHTIGQRKGLGPLLSKGFVHIGPWYTVEKNVSQNILYVTNNINVVDKPRRLFHVESVNWICGPPVLQNDATSVEVQVKLRHGPNIIPGVLYPTKDGSDFQNVHVELSKRDKGIAPGQFAAFYIDDFCLGTGVISETVSDFSDVSNDDISEELESGGDNVLLKHTESTSLVTELSIDEAK